MTSPRFATYAKAVLGLNILVILWGALVRATGSGAGCGSHWPLCNGEVVPRAAGIETMIELTHRLTSGLALVAVGLMAWWAFRIFPRGHRVRWAALASLALIIVEALIGAGLVLLELVAENASLARGYWMVGHLINTFILIAALTLTAAWAAGMPRLELAGRQREVGMFALGFVTLLLVGATGAIAALGDTLFPAATLADGLRDSISADSHPLVRLRKLHPLIAIVSGALVAVIARGSAARDARPVVRQLASTLLGLYVVQLVLGALNVALLAPVWMQLIHLLLANAVWVALVLLAAMSLAADRTADAPVGSVRAAVAA